MYQEDTKCIKKIPNGTKKPQHDNVKKLVLFRKSLHGPLSNGDSDERGGTPSPFNPPFITNSGPIVKLIPISLTLLIPPTSSQFLLRFELV